MTLSIIAIILAFIIAFGRQIAVFGKRKIALWFFPNFELKRIVFSSIVLLFVIIDLRISTNNTGTIVIASIAFFLLLLSFLFDFKYIFPEIKKVERKLGNTLNIEGNTEIIGVTQNNISVAYPLNVVIPRHIINDKIEDTNIVVSYCAICRSALIFKAEIEGIRLYFKVSGVWRRNMVMIDNQSKSLWQQTTGECIYGKYKGQNLTLLSGENTTWKSWSQKHPKSEYAYKCTEARKSYLSRKKMLRGLYFITPKITPPGFTDLIGLEKRETVFGITYNGISRAYPQSKIDNLIQFTDVFNERKLELTYDKSATYLSAIDSDSKESIIVEKHWWLGWKEFHPNTEIWNDKN